MTQQGGDREGGSGGLWFNDDGGEDSSYRRRERSPGKTSKVLLLTIERPDQTIDMQVIHSLCSKYGKVERVVILRKNIIQALVEFETMDMSKSALESLDGEDIYTGCCRMRTEFSKTESLNINRNGPDRCDFTIKNPVRQASAQRPRRGMLGDPPSTNPTNGLYPDPMGDSRFDNNDRRYSMNGITDATDLIRSLNIQGSMNGPQFGNGQNNTGRGLPQYQDNNSNKNPVVMLYNLSKEMNANRVFNMLCLYGNVFKVKFLRSKEGCAMVEMGDGPSVDRAIINLDSIVIFDNKITVAYSKQSYLTEVTEPYDLNDGSPSYKNFMSSRNNRFLDPNLATKNRFVKPTRILHFYNTPPGLREETLEEVFSENGIPQPKSFHMLPSLTNKSSRGLLEFCDDEEAMEALVLANNIAIPNDEEEKAPFIMKLTYSSSRAMPVK